MILPNNGKVIVFDDKIDDVDKLLSSLSKEQIPYLYYSDEYAGDLPDNPIENVRLVFLDLELVTNNPNPRNIIGPIAQRLKKTIYPNNLYILIYWSTKENKYRADLEKEFESGGLQEYKPLAILSLDKAKAKHEGLKYIQDSLKEELKPYHALTAFMLWESSVNNAAGSITNRICSIFEKDSKWDTNMHGMIYELAKAQAGIDTIKDRNNTQLLELAIDVINSNLIEAVEKKFQNVSDSINVDKIKPTGSGMSENEKINLNTKIHLITAEKKFNHFVPGNLYIKKLNAIGREIVQRNLNTDIIKTLKEESIKLVCIDLTPACDYSRGKNYSRIIYGIMLDKSITKKNLIQGEYRYTNCPIMKLENDTYIVIDFRCIRSYNRTELEYHFHEKPKYRLRSNLLLDIQAQLSNHINRPGIITV